MQINNDALAERYEDDCMGLNIQLNHSWTPAKDRKIGYDTTESLATAHLP